MKSEQRHREIDGATASLTRGDVAALFDVSTKTIMRWQERFGLSHERQNARVIRYDTESVIQLVAHGAHINRGEAARLNLRIDEILSAAGAIHSSPGATSERPQAEIVFIAKTEEDRNVIRLLGHPIHGPYLRKFAAAFAY